MVARRRARGFTLVEVLAAVAIVGLLLALLLPFLRPPRRHFAGVSMSSLRTGITTLKTGLGLAVGDFLAVNADGLALPVDAEGWHVWTDSGGATHRFEIGKELDPGNPAWADDFSPYRNRGGERYHEFTKHEIQDGRPVDPWGNPYRCEIRSVSDGKVEEERLISAGADGRWETEDDVFEVLARRAKSGT